MKRQRRNRSYKPPARMKGTTYERAGGGFFVVIQFESQQLAKEYRDHLNRSGGVLSYVVGAHVEDMFSQRIQ